MSKVLTLTATMFLSLLFTACGGGGGTAPSSAPLTSSNPAQSPETDPLPQTTPRTHDTYTDPHLLLMWQDDIDAKLVTKPWLEEEYYDACREDKESGSCENTSGDTATTYCENKVLSGHSDWRLPSSDELWYLYNTHSGDLKNINVNKHSWTSTTVPSEGYWLKGEPYIDSSSNAYAGRTYSKSTGIYSEKKSDKMYIRCVRGVALVEPKPSLGNSSIITDNEARIMIQDNVHTKMTTKRWLTLENFNSCHDSWVNSRKTVDACYDTQGDTARTYCEELVLEGYSSWRLPSKDEISYIKSNIKSDNINIEEYWENDPTSDSSKIKYQNVMCVQSI